MKNVPFFSLELFCVFFFLLKKTIFSFFLARSSIPDPLSSVVKLINLRKRPHHLETAPRTYLLFNEMMMAHGLIVWYQFPSWRRL
jgi:hypothetical protein